MMRVKNHQMPPTIRVDKALGMSSEPGGSLFVAAGLVKTPNPQRQWDVQSSSSKEQQQSQAEATTLLHESPNSKPETIEQRKIVFHYIRVGVAWMRVVPLPLEKQTDVESDSRDRRGRKRPLRQRLNLKMTCDDTIHRMQEL
ncbi:hypothetical protein EYF80_027375 [Liparis tanakae]|uniref:Uncharacterized protein n=1 Tax=Liparis tanakae TaxID=230148 RepID=A0A4Z2HBU7_9TELE|nr:hypothetical protein EYF80_027375 [Liparis tanakae]